MCLPRTKWILILFFSCCGWRLPNEKIIRTEKCRYAYLRRAHFLHLLMYYGFVCRTLNANFQFQFVKIRERDREWERSVPFFPLEANQNRLDGILLCLIFVENFYYFCSLNDVLSLYRCRERFIKYLLGCGGGCGFSKHATFGMPKIAPEIFKATLSSFFLNTLSVCCSMLMRWMLTPNVKR